MEKFEKELKIILNVEVGGKLLNEKIGKRKWEWEGNKMRELWESRREWMKKWKEEEEEMKIDYIRVYNQ
jgi:hypothetical protein